MPDIVVDCPHCGHALHLPTEYLGRVVSCLECEAPFRAPVKDGDGYTQPIALAKSRGVPAKLFIPLVGLLVLGVMGLVLNGYFLANPKASEDYVRSTLSGLIAQDPPEKAEWKIADAKKKPDAAELARRQEISDDFRRDARAKLDRQLDENMPDSTRLRYFGLATSGLTFLGGLAFLLRRGYAIAFLGCVGATLNSPDMGCCLVGGIVAIWGVLALISDEGRRYFRRAA